MTTYLLLNLEISGPEEPGKPGNPGYSGNSEEPGEFLTLFQN